MEESGEAGEGKPRVTHREHDLSEVDPTTAVVESVANVAGCDPVALEPLTEYVDPDALDRLVQSSTGETAVSLRYADHRVTVRSDGRVSVRRAQE